MSTAGVCFLSEGSFEEGQLVSLTVTLQHADPAGALDVTCRGVVVRSQGPESETGARPVRRVAMAIDTDRSGAFAFASAS